MQPNDLRCTCIQLSHRTYTSAQQTVYAYIYKSVCRACGPRSPLLLTTEARRDPCRCATAARSQEDSYDTLPASGLASR
jgi:hypothetical protein